MDSLIRHSILDVKGYCSKPPAKRYPGLRTKFQPTWTGFFELLGTADIVPYLLNRLAAKFKRPPAHTGSHSNDGRGIVP